MENKTTDNLKMQEEALEMKDELNAEYKKVFGEGGFRLTRASVDFLQEKERKDYDKKRYFKG